MSDDRLETILEVVRGDKTAEQAADELGIAVSEVRKDVRRIRKAAAQPTRAESRPAAGVKPSRRGGATRRVVLLAGAVLVGMAVLAGIGFGTWRWLVSRRSAEEQACDDAIIERLRRLQQQMTITLYVSPGTPKLQLSADVLAKLLARYAAASDGKLKFVRVDVTTDEQKQQAKESGLQEVAFGESQDGEAVSLARGYYGLVFVYGPEKDAIPLLSPEENRGMEFWIANKITAIVATAEERFSTIGVSLSEGGVNIADPHLVPPQAGGSGPNLVSIFAQAMPFYKLTDTPLNAPVPEEVEVLVVTQPGPEGIGDDARRHVDDFLMRGDKALVVIGGAVNVPPHDASMQAELHPRGLDALLAPYGVELQPTLVLSEDSMKLPVQTTGGATQELGLASLLEVTHDESASAETQTLDDDFAGFFHIEEVAFPYASSLVAHPDRQPSATLRVIARSSAKSSLVDTKRVSLGLTDHVEPNGAQQQVPLAIALQGTIRSAFGERQAPGRILVVASAQFLANPFARAGNPPAGETTGDANLQAVAVAYAQRYLTATILVFKNIVDWANAEGDLHACSALLLAASAE